MGISNPGILVSCARQQQGLTQFESVTSPGIFNPHKSFIDVTLRGTLTFTAHVAILCSLYIYCHYNLFILRKTCCKLRIKGEPGFLRVNRLHWWKHCLHVWSIIGWELTISDLLELVSGGGGGTTMIPVVERLMEIPSCVWSCNKSPFLNNHLLIATATLK